MAFYFVNIWFIGSAVNAAILAAVLVAKISAANNVGGAGKNQGL